MLSNILRPVIQSFCQQIGPRKTQAKFSDRLFGNNATSSLPISRSPIGLMTGSTLKKCAFDDEAVKFVEIYKRFNVAVTGSETVLRLPVPEQNADGVHLDIQIITIIIHPYELRKVAPREHFSPLYRKFTLVNCTAHL